MTSPDEREREREHRTYQIRVTFAVDAPSLVDARSYALTIVDQALEDYDPEPDGLAIIGWKSPWIGEDGV